MTNQPTGHEGAAGEQYCERLLECGKLLVKLENATAALTEAEKALQAIPDDIDFLMATIRGLEAFASTHGYEADVDDVLRGTEIRARARELRELLARIAAAKAAGGTKG